MRLSHLGDVVHALPVFHALRAARGRAEIAWAVQPEFAGLLEGLPGLDRVFRFDRRGGARAWITLLSQIRSWAPDWAIDAQGNAKSGLVTIGSGAGRRSGLNPRDWREPFAARVLNDPAPAVEAPVVHAMQRMIVLARHVAPGEATAAAPRRDPALSAAEIEAGRARLEQLVGSGDRPLALLHLSSPQDVRSWPIASFEVLARTLAGGEHRVLVVSGPREEAEGRELERRLAGAPGVSHWHAQRDPRGLAALFHAARGRSGRLVACDSGPMHLAAAVGLPVVCLAGPQDPRRTGPWPLPGTGSHHLVVRATTTPDCAPCLSRVCSHPEGPVCMLGIDPRAVAAAARLSSSVPDRRRPRADSARDSEETQPCSPSSSPA